MQRDLFARGLTYRSSALDPYSIIPPHMIYVRRARLRGYAHTIMGRLQLPIADNKMCCSAQFDHIRDRTKKKNKPGLILFSSWWRSDV